MDRGSRNETQELRDNIEMEITRISAEELREEKHIQLVWRRVSTFLTCVIRRFQHRTRYPSTQARTVKIPAPSRGRQSLEVITEEVAQQYTRRRKQLIPRARLKRAEESIKRLQGSRSPGLHPQHIPRIRSHQELRLLLTPPPDFRTDDFSISNDTKRRPSGPDDYYKYLQPLAEQDHRQAFQSSEPIYVTKTQSEVGFSSKSSEEYTKKPISPEADYTPTLPKSNYIQNTRLYEKENFRKSEVPNEKDCYNRLIAPPSDLIGIPFEKGVRKRPRNNGEIHTIKIEGVNSRSNVIPLPTGRINSKTLVKSKACSLSKLNITNVIVSDCSDKEFTERLYHSANFAPNSPPHISTYVVDEPTIPRLPYGGNTIIEETQNNKSECLGTSGKQNKWNTQSNKSEEESEGDYTEINLNNEEDEKSLSCKGDSESIHNKLKNKHSGIQEKRSGNSNLKFKDKTENYNNGNINVHPDFNVDPRRKFFQLRDIKKNSDRQGETVNESEHTKYTKHNKLGSPKVKSVNSNKLVCKDKTSSEAYLDSANESTTHNTKENKECFLGLKAKIITNYLSQEGENLETLNISEHPVNKTSTNNNKEYIDDTDQNITENKEENKTYEEYKSPFDFHPVKEKAAKFQKLSNNIKEKVEREIQEKSVGKHNTSDRKTIVGGDKSNQKQETNEKPKVTRSISCNTGNIKIREVEICDTHNSEDKTGKIDYCTKSNQINSETEKSKHTSAAKLIYNYMRGKPKRSESVRETKSRSQDLSTHISSKQKNTADCSPKAHEVPFDSDVSKINDNLTENSYEVHFSRTKSLEYLSTPGIEENGTTLWKHHDKFSSDSKCKHASKHLKTEDNVGAFNTKRKINKNLTSELNNDVEINKKTTEGDISVRNTTNKDSEEFNDNLSKDLLNEKTIMSRRPQVLKITDSATTSSPPRCVTGERRDVTGYGVIRQRHASEDNTNMACKMKTIFEGTPSTLNEKGEKCEDIEDACEKVSPTKPMLIATLSVEDDGDTLQKSKKETSSPIQVFNSQTLPAKIPAFRAFSCNGQETLSNIKGSVPDFMDVRQKKTELGDKIQTKERNYKVAAFDGLLQYLQDYRHGLRELLVNNNVVIIEPVRQSKVKLEDKNYAARKSTSESTCRITGATIKATSNSANTTPGSNTLPRQQKSQQPVLRRHFFYHPKKTNRELLDEELPDPDKVRNAREMFERTLKMKTPSGDNFKTGVNTKCDHAKPNTKPVNDTKSDNTHTIKTKRKYLTVDTVFRHNVLHKRWTDSGSLSSGVSSDLSCYDTDLESPCSRGDNFSRNSNHKEETPDIFSSDDNDYADDNDSKHCYLDDGDEGHYVSPEVLEKIRACGTTVTYYGGQVISSSNGPVRSPMTLAIMDEIRNSKNSPKYGKEIRIIKDEYLGMKFRLVKSNSCSSRLELAGTEDEGNFRDEWNSTEEKTVHSHENDEIKEHTVIKCEPKQESTETNQRQREEVKLSTIEEKNNEEKMAAVETLDSVFKRRDETSFMFGKANMYENFHKVGPPRTCFSPEKTRLIEKRSNVLFDDMEFEEFEIADDSLNVVEEDKKLDNQKNEQTESGQNLEKSNDLLPNTSTKLNGDVQMTTWASRSVLFDFKNSESESPHLSIKKSDCNQSTC